MLTSEQRGALLHLSLNIARQQRIAIAFIIDVKNRNYAKRVCILIELMLSASSPSVPIFSLPAQYMMYIHTYIHTHTYTYIHIHTHTYIHTQIYTHKAENTHLRDLSHQVFLRRQPQETERCHWPRHLQTCEPKHARLVPQTTKGP